MMKSEKLYRRCKPDGYIYKGILLDIPLTSGYTVYITNVVSKEDHS